MKENKANVQRIIAIGLLAASLTFLAAASIRTYQLLKQASERLGASDFRITGVSREGIGVEFKNVKQNLKDAVLNAISIETTLPGAQSCRIQSVSISTQDAVIETAEISAKPCPLFELGDGDLNMDFSGLILKSGDDSVRSEKGTLAVSKVSQWIRTANACSQDDDEECFKVLSSMPEMTVKLVMNGVAASLKGVDSKVNLQSVSANLRGLCQRGGLKDILSVEVEVNGEDKNAVFRIDASAKDFPPEVMAKFLTAPLKKTRDERITVIVDALREMRSATYNAGVSPAVESRMELRSNGEPKSELSASGAVGFAPGGSSIKYNFNLSATGIENVNKISSQTVKDFISIVCDKDPCTLSRTGEIKLDR